MFDIHFSRFGVKCGVSVCLALVSYTLASCCTVSRVCKINLLDIRGVYDKQMYDRFCLYVIQITTDVIQYRHTHTT